MIHRIDDKTLEELDISYDEYLLLKSFSITKDSQIVKDLRDKGLLDYKFECTEKGLSTIQVVEERSGKNRDNTDLENLAIEMRALFPKGNKTGGTTWRGNIHILSKKLAAFFETYGYYSDEAVLDATRRYVEKFNGDYKYMRTLSYFISKDERKKGGEETSLLADYLENEDSETAVSDWLTEER